MGGTLNEQCRVSEEGLRIVKLCCKRKNDILVSLFNELLEFDNRLKKYIPPLTEEIILKVIKSVGMRVRSHG